VQSRKIVSLGPEGSRTYHLSTDFLHLIQPFLESLIKFKESQHKRNDFFPLHWCRTGSVSLWWPGQSEHIA
jgi:hypothetical protein